MRINGISQLEDMVGLDGYLCVVDVEPDDDGTDCEDLARSVRARTSDRAAFDALLITAGLRPGRPAGRWRHGTVTLCPAHSVPRIIPSSLVVPLPAGIRAVTYDVDRSVVDAFSLARPDSVLASLGSAP